MLETIVIPDNPCKVEIQQDYGPFQMAQILGEKWIEKLENLPPDQLKTDLKPYADRGMFQGAYVCSSLLADNKSSRIDKIFYLFNLELPNHLKGQGYGSKAFEMVVKKAKDEGFDYLLCDAVTDDGLDFVQKKGLEHHLGPYWGISLKD